MGDLFAPWHIIVLLIAFIVLFGSKKLPDAARALGQSMRIFKAETRALGDDGARHQAGQGQTVQQAPPQPAVPATPQMAVPPADGTAVTGASLADVQRNQPPS